MGLSDDGATRSDLEHERARVAEKLRLRPRVLTASAKTGRHVRRLLTEALALGDRMAGRIPTPELNRFLAEAVQARQPPVGTRRGSGQHRLKLIYMAQIGERPPRFAIQVNSRARVTRDYAYFLENRLRARYGMDGVPLVIDFVERGQRAGTAGGRPPARRRLPGLSATLQSDHWSRAARMSQLPDNEFLFTSESVTEGHPDKIADQISDGVLDAVLTDDPYGRVACETLVNTGLIVVSGEISTDTYVDIQEIARETVRRIGYDDAGLRLRLRHLRGDQRDRQAVARTSPRASTRRMRRATTRRRGRARRRRRGRPGHDVRLRHATRPTS